MNTIWTSGRTSLRIGWAELIYGAWLILSPFVLGFAHYPAGMVNNIVVGLALILLTIGSARNGLLRALLVLLGGWVYASGFLLNVPKSIFLWNNLILALLILVYAVASATPVPENPPRA